MTREEIRDFAAEHNGGQDLPDPGYDLDPTSADYDHWITIAQQARRRGDAPMLGWMWRHAPDITDGADSLLTRIDHMGMCSV